MRNKQYLMSFGNEKVNDEAEREREREKNRYCLYSVNETERLVQCKSN